MSEAHGVRSAHFAAVRVLHTLALAWRFLVPTLALALAVHLGLTVLTLQGLHVKASSSPRHS